MGKKGKIDLKNMSEEELKKWELKLREMHKYTSQTNMVNKIKQGRGWIY